MQSTLGSNSSSLTGTNARETAANVSGKAHAGIDKLTATAHQTVDRVATAATSAAERLNMSESKFAHSAHDFKESTCAYVREHPMAAVGIAVAAGYLFSRLTSR
jgi:ElaB/YqjD/DUF883 family membrane-anchored ribosome-binding protein